MKGYTPYTKDDDKKIDAENPSGAIKEQVRRLEICLEELNTGFSRLEQRISSAVVHKQDIPIKDQRGDEVHANYSQLADNLEVIANGLLELIERQADLTERVDL